MLDIAVTSPQPYGSLFRKPYHHRNVPAALRDVARQMLEAGDPEEVGLRELSRRIGVSPGAAYRHFSGRNDLMASVAVEGFQELTLALQAAVKEPDPVIAIGLAYVEFALTKRGMFRLMFGPLLAQRTKYPALRKAADAAFEVIVRSGLTGEHEGRDDTAGMAAWGLFHGLSALFIENLAPATDARRLAQQIFAGASHGATVMAAAA